MVQSNKKIVIVHDWLVGGGAEQVVLALHEMYPDAPIYTSYCSPEWQKKLDNKVVTGYLQHWPFSKLRKFLPVLRIWWFQSLNLTAYDVVISSSGNGEAKGVKKLSPNAKHIWYCHSPTHFYWDKYDEYIKNPGFGIFNPIAILGLKILVKLLRKRDYKVAQLPDIVVANSTHIQQKIKQYYGRESIIIHPPVNIERFQAFANSFKRSGYITVGRQTPYKRTNIIVEACTKLNVPLTIIGYGPEHESLKKIASSNCIFIKNASSEQVEELLPKAKAFLFAAEEDFGIAPVEALAAGTPVIAYGKGGTLDYVIDGETGILFEEQNVDSLIKAIEKSKKTNWDHKKISSHSQKFNKSTFKEKIAKLIT